MSDGVRPREKRVIVVEVMATKTEVYELAEKIEHALLFDGGWARPWSKVHGRHNAPCCVQHPICSPPDD